MYRTHSANDRQQLKKAMREEWDDCAHGKWRHYIWAEAADSEESFRASGERDYKRYVGKFLSTFQVDPARLIALEIGCGPGRVSEFLARDFRGLLALDLSREMLKIGRQRIPADNVLWLCNDGMSLAPIADNSVDFIFSMGVFQQIPDAATIADYVRDTGRILRPGGWLIFQVMNHPHFAVGPWTVSFFVSSRFHIPRLRIYKPDVLDACPIRLGFARRTCVISGLEVVRVLHRFTQNTWIWARKKP
ncbi:MAG: class I SAM-dependent methyltransferase [Acidobacteriota bacterium]